MKESPYFNIVGETWLNSNVADCVLAEKTSELYLPTVMDFPLQGLMNQVFDEETGGGRWSICSVTIFLRLSLRQP